jgi:hypothetical protein
MKRGLALVALLSTASGCSFQQKFLLGSAGIVAALNGGIGAAVAHSGEKGRGFLYGAAAGAVGLPIVIWGLMRWFPGKEHSEHESSESKVEPPKPPPPGQFHGQTGFLILLGIRSDYGQALIEAHQHHAALVQSGLFESFDPGQFLVVAEVYPTEAEAQAALPGWPGEPFIRSSGRIRGTLPALVRLTGRLAAPRSPVVHARSKDGELDIHPDPACRLCYELWAASPGVVELEMGPTPPHSQSEDSPEGCIMDSDDATSVEVPPGAAGDIEVQTLEGRCY